MFPASTLVQLTREPLTVLNLFRSRLLSLYMICSAQPRIKPEVFYLLLLKVLDLSGRSDQLLPFQFLQF